HVARRGVTALFYLFTFRLCHTPLSLLIYFFFSSSADHRALHSFPTRRSSDLTFKGLIGKIPYLLELGVTVVELMPVFQFDPGMRDRKSTRLNSSHGSISYAVFCLKKKKTTHIIRQ